jgi:hypothetical protein
MGFKDTKQGYREHGGAFWASNATRIIRGTTSHASLRRTARSRCCANTLMSSGWRMAANALKAGHGIVWNRTLAAASNSSRKARS